MTQLEEQIVATLRDKAGDEIDIAGLLTTSRERGRAYRRRSRALRVGGAATLAVVAVLGAVVAVPALAGSDHALIGFAGVGSAAPGPASGPASTGPASTGPTATPSASPGRNLTFRPPVEAGAVPATADPKVVGVDPTLLHVDLADAGMPASSGVVQWTSVDGLERLIVASDSSGSLVQVQVSRDRSALDPLSGRTRTVPVGPLTGTYAGPEPGQLRWQPLPGVWAQVQAPGDATALARLAGLVSFDHVLRCVVPFRLTAVPAGATVEACSTVFESERTTGSATVHIGQSDVTVEVDRGVTVRTPTTTVGGHPASVREYPGDGGKPVLQVDIDEGDRVVSLLAAGSPDRATVLAVAAGCQTVRDDDPRRWPSPRLP